MAEISFKERVRTELIGAAKQYKEIYIDYEYLICSEAFTKKDYYIIAAAKDNFMHLTGVNALVSAQEFFDKCYNGSLTETDFDFSKSGQDEKSVKGTVRRKVQVLPDMMELFHDGLLTEEDFNQKEIIRNNIIKREGYKMFRIISSKDRLPSDDVLIEILNTTKNYFKQYPNHSWMEFNIDKGNMRNAENIDGVPFNFGKTTIFYKK